MRHVRLDLLSKGCLPARCRLTARSFEVPQEANPSENAKVHYHLGMAYAKPGFCRPRARNPATVPRIGVAANWQQRWGSAGTLCLAFFDKSIESPDVMKVGYWGGWLSLLDGKRGAARGRTIRSRNARGRAMDRTGRHGEGGAGRAGGYRGRCWHLSRRRYATCQRDNRTQRRRSTVERQCTG